MTASVLPVPWRKAAAAAAAVHNVVQRRALAAPTARIQAYRTVSVVCNGCGETLLRYKKRNGTKSALVKCYVDRLVADPHGILSRPSGAPAACPGCGTIFAREAVIHGRAALKLVGGKTRMKKR